MDRLGTALPYDVVPRTTPYPGLAYRPHECLDAALSTSTFKGSESLIPIKGADTMIGGV